MAVNAEKENRIIRLWLLLHRVGYSLGICEDLIFGNYGLTSEQFGVLSSIKSRGPLRIVDLSNMLERSPNSMSMLVDRMLKAGLVTRKRDRKDRRVVFVNMTDKGSEAIDLALPRGWEFVHKLLSPISNDEQAVLVNLLETIKCELTCYLNPEMDKAEIAKNSFTNDPDFYKRAVKKYLDIGYDVKQKRGKK